MGQGTDWAAVSQLVLLVLFVIFVSIGAFTTTRRLIRYWRGGQRPPTVLYRDVVARLSLSLPFLAILAARSLRSLEVIHDDALVSNPWWIFGTGLPAVFGAALYAYYELFVIEQNGNGPPKK